MVEEITYKIRYSKCYLSKRKYYWGEKNYICINTHTHTYICVNMVSCNAYQCENYSAKHLCNVFCGSGEIRNEPLWCHQGFLCLKASVCVLCRELYKRCDWCLKDVIIYQAGTKENQRKAALRCSLGSSVFNAWLRLHAQKVRISRLWCINFKPFFLICHTSFSLLEVL